MKKRYYILSVIAFSVVVLAGALWWLTERVLPNLGVVHLVPLEEKARQFSPNGDIIVILKHSKLEGYRGIESIEIGWSGVGAVWPHILAGMMIGAIAGYFMGLPKRKSIDFAKTSLAHSEDIMRATERKEKEAARKMSDAKALELKNSERSAELDRREKELKRRSDEAERLIVYAHGLIREADAQNGELIKAKAKIRRLEKRNRQAEKKIDEADQAD